MRFSELISRINNLASDDEVALYFKALRQNSVIWDEFKDLSSEDSRVLALSRLKQPLTAGTLALVSFDIEFDFDTLDKNRFSPDMLEKVMLGYEEYLLADSPISSMDQIGQVALALIAKQKDAGNWIDLIEEILGRKKIADNEEFERFWLPVLIAVINLVTERNTFLKQILSVTRIDLILSSAVQMVLALPISDNEKSCLLQEQLHPLDEQAQLNALRILKQFGGSEIVTEIAAYLLEKYQDLDLSSRSTRDYWKEPVESTRLAFRCQVVADIAQLAGEDDAALELNEKALAILSALVKKGKVKKAGISKLDRFKVNIKDIFSGDELQDPDIQAELVYSQDQEIEDFGGFVHPVKTIRQSKKLVEAGNPELAKEEIHATLASLTEGELEQFLVKGPNQIQTWEPEEFIQSLLDMGAYDAVRRVSSILLRENPTNMTVNLAAAKSAEVLGDTHKAVNNYETLVLVQPESIDTKRKLAEMYIADAQPDNALRMYQEIIDRQETPDEKDLLALAELAIQQGKFKEAKEAASKVLELNPENAQALTLMGMAHRLSGNIDSSEKYLRNAIEFTAGDNRPWLELAELQWSTDKHADAIVALQEGIAAIPNEKGIKTTLAKKLMSDGRVSEAYPLLTDLSNHGADLESDLLLVDAMDTLGIEGVEELLEVLVERYPDDPRFLGDYGKRLVWSGETAKGLGLLDRLGEDINSNTEWKLSQIEAKWQTDFCNLVFDKKPARRELKEILTFLDEYLSDKPDDSNARLLKAEALLNSGEFGAAFELFKDLNRENIVNQIVDQSRLTADISIAAAGCGELEIAKAALEKAISLQPGWHGLKAVKARFLHETGEDAEAVQLLYKTLEEVPQSAANQSWAIQFLYQIGRVDAASKLLDDSMQRYPENLGLNLLKTEIFLTVASQATDPNADDLFYLLQQEATPAELIRAAAVYAEFEDQDRTTWCLQKAIDAGSEEAFFYLAGLHRINKDYSVTRHTLETISYQSELVSLLIIETQLASGEMEQPQLPLIEVDRLPLEFEFREVFLPGEWKELLQSSRPAISLAVKIAMQTGDFAAATEAVRNWIDDEPNNVEARIYGIELALACADRDWYEQLASSKPDVQSGIYANHLNLLVIESLYEHGVDIDTPVENYGLFETINLDEPDKISIIREQHLAGRINEAETTFEMAIGVYSNLAGIPFISKLGILRNLVKSAMLLDRWSDAVEYADRAFNLAPANDMVKFLRLQVAARALEFENQVYALSLNEHGHSTIKDHTATLLRQQAAVRETDSKSVEFQHWLIRLTLAQEATKENIHELAQLTPGADDAAAMMAGLRAIGQTDTALRIGRKFAENPVAMNEMAVCLQESQPEEAINWLKKSIEKDPYQPIALRMLSVLFENRKELSEAVSSLESALELWPNESAWHISAAELWQRLGNTEKPLEHLQIASLYSPKNVDIHRLLGGAFLAAGRMADALPHLTTVVEKNPQDYDTWIALSELYQATGDLDLALKSAERATELNPSGVKARLQTARANWKKGSLKHALEQAKQAIGLDPHDPANYVFMARLSKEQGDTAKALELLEKAEKVNPASLQTVIEHANLIKEINGVIAARDLIAAFSKKFPENPDLLVLLADAEEQCGDARSAETAAQKALDIKPGEKDILMLLGRIVEKNGNLDRAAHYYSQAVSLEPEVAEGYLKLSQVYIRQREYNQARKVLEQGIKEITGNVDLYLSCAALLKESKDYRGAEQMLRKASVIEPRNVSIHRQLGAILALNMVHQSQEVGSQV